MSKKYEQGGQVSPQSQGLCLDPVYGHAEVFILLSFMKALF